VIQNERIFTAIEFAAKAHHGQFRKGTNLPYIFHPLGVAKILLDLNCPEDMVIAAMLHDTVEDTAVTIEDINLTFGETVAYLVHSVSEPDKRDSWEIRKCHTLESLKTAPMEVLLLACAEKLDNIRSTHAELVKNGESVWQRFNRSKNQQQWYFESLATIFKNRIDNEPSATLFTQFFEEVKKVFGENLSVYAA